MCKPAKKLKVVCIGIALRLRVSGVESSSEDRQAVRSLPDRATPRGGL